MGQLRYGIRHSSIALGCLAGFMLAGSGVRAAENGLGFYLLGSKGPLAAILPPTGVYFQNDAYFYSGDLSASRQLPFGGNIGAGVKARAFIDLPTVIWTTPWEIFGGYPPADFGHQGLNDEFRGRAICANGGIICNDAVEAVYVAKFTGADGKPLDGAKSYTLRFEKGGLPPVNEFWSITMYGPDYNLVPNPVNRFSIRDRTPGVTQAADGSTTLYLQATSPGPGKESNWLPTPKSGAFSMILRAYVPKDPILKQTWMPPTVAEVQ